MLVVGDDEARERLNNDLECIVYRVYSGYRLCVLGDMNGWVGDRVRVDMLVLLEFQEE